MLGLVGIGGHYNMDDLMVASHMQYAPMKQSKHLTLLIKNRKKDSWSQLPKIANYSFKRNSESKFGQ
ncbi:hypothetical protein Lal_00010029, partial [Lupinus albus]